MLGWQLVAELHSVDDLVCFISLYLEGMALVLYLEIEEKDQLSAENIEVWLMEAFTEGPFMAYGQLVKAKWTAEQINVFANEIRRSAKL